jgi:ketosteroid isomerase-like protein
MILARRLYFKPPTNIEPGTAWLPNGHCENNTSVGYISVYYTLVHSTPVCGISLTHSRLCAVKDGMIQSVQEYVVALHVAMLRSPICDP